MRPTWIEIDTEAIRKNVKNLKACAESKVDFMGVIKADAYGHGAVKIAKILQEEDVKWFGVVMVEEGIQLRKQGFKEPILILGPIPEEDYPRLLEYELTPGIYKLSQAIELNNIAEKTNKRATIHIKIDTGMGRLGFIPDERSIEEIKEIINLPDIFVEGIYTHLSTADEKYNEYAREQYKKFIFILDELKQQGITIPIRHMANSAATMNFKEMHLDMIRPGTSIYGLYPGPEMIENPTVDLYPAMSIKSKLMHIKTVPPDTSVSYSRTFITKKPSKIGVIPMGYVDGVFRLLANKGEVLIRGKRCPIVGNICMDQFMVDITDLKDVNIGDEVVILGEQGDDRISAEEIGAHAGTISIEVVTRIGKRVPIYYV